MIKPGKELDALIAEKVMGWERKCIGDDYYLENPRAHHLSKYNAPQPYSTHIAAAWEVVEKIVEDTGMEYVFWSLAGDNKRNVFQFVEKKGENNYIKAYEEGETLSHAICKTALKAVGVEV